MTLSEIQRYVILDVDDSDFTLDEVSLWFNKAISNYNLMVPISTYPLYSLVEENRPEESPVTDDLGYKDDYPLSDMFLLGIMLPYINSSIKSQESSIEESLTFRSEFAVNAQRFKNSSAVPLEFMFEQATTDLNAGKLGEGVYITDMRQSPFAGDWALFGDFPEWNYTTEEEE